jgi:ankyrin repeat protein
MTPPHIASDKGHIEIVHELLEKGASIEAAEDII